MNWINRKNQNGNSDREKDFPFARWMSWLFLAASIVLLIYTYYLAEITYQGGSSSTYFKYYLISLTGILFWGAVLLLREGIQANIVTVSISLVVVIYLFEGGLTFLGLGQIDRVAAAEELGVEYDLRTRLEVIEDLITKGVDTVPTVAVYNHAQYLHNSALINKIGTTKTDIDHLLPLGGVSNKTTVSGNESGKYLVYMSDRHGFHNPDSQWDSKELEWLLTGDSFTLGEAVQPGQEIAGQIRSITGNSAINLGISGNGPLLEYAALVEYGKTLTPAKVLWIYFEGNDLISDLKLEKTNSLLMQYMEDEFSQNLINRQKEIDNSLEKYIEIARAQHSEEEEAHVTQLEINAQRYKTGWIRLSRVRKVLGFDVVDVDVEVDIDYPLFAKILTKAKGEVEAWEGELYFIYLPEYGRYNNKTISHDKFRKKTEVIDLVKQLDIPVIDIHQEVFANHSDPLSLFPFRLSGHYNADGYSEVAKAIVTGVNKYEQSNKEEKFEND